MRKVDRRTLMATGTTLAAGGLVGSTATAQEGDDGEGGAENGGAGSVDFERPDGVAWRYDGAHNVRNSTVAHGRFYTEHDGTVSAIDAADGSLVWETDDIGTDGTPVVRNNLVYVPGERVQALDTETGEIQWESDVGRDTMVVGHGMVYTSAEGTVYALDDEDGSVVWERDEVTIERQTGGETEEATIESLAAGDTDEDWVYVFDDDSWGREVIGLDPTTGETGVVVGPMDGVTAVFADSGYLGVQPPYDSTRLIDVSTSETLGGISQSVGQAFSGDGYFTANVRGKLSAYDLSAGGELAWEMVYAQSYPKVVGNTAVVLYGPNSLQHDPEESEDEDRVIAYDLQTGEEQWRYVFDEREWDSSSSSGLLTGVEIDENTVYVSRDGELLALRSEDEEGGEGEPEPRDVEFEYEYTHAAPDIDGEDVKSKIELSSAEVVDSCAIEFEAANLTDDAVINGYFNGSLESAHIHDRQFILEPGESRSYRLDGSECPDEDPAHGVVAVGVTYISEAEEEGGPDDENPEEDAESEEDDRPGEEEESVEEAPSGDFDLSVSAPDSIARGESASFDVRVWNHGDGAAEVTASLEVGDHTDSSTVEIAAGDCYASFHSVWCGNLSMGDNEWTVTAGEETESGTLTLTDG